LIETLEDKDGGVWWQLKRPRHVYNPLKLSKHEVALIRDTFDPFYIAGRIKRVANSDLIEVAIRAVAGSAATLDDTRRPLHDLYGKDAFDGWAEADISLEPAASLGFPHKPHLGYALMYDFVACRPKFTRRRRPLT
jgi:hypothetical protein